MSSYTAYLSLIGVCVWLWQSPLTIEVMPDMLHQIKALKAVDWCSQINTNRVTIQEYRNITQFIGIPQTCLTPEESVLAQAYQCGHGFITGSGDNITELSCALASDLSVIGDIRDIGSESYALATHQEVDEITMVLAGIGLVSSVGVVITGGMMVPVKIGVTVLKVAQRTGHLTASFIKFLHLRRVGNIMQDAELMKVFRNIYTVSKMTSVPDTIRVMKYIDNPNDLERVTTLAQNWGQHTVTVLKVLGKSALRVTRLVWRALIGLLSLIGLLLFLLVNLFKS